MILTVTPNPCVDKTIFYDRVELGGRHRSERYTCIPGGKGINVSRAVKVFGQPTAAMLIVGGPTGQHVLDMIEEQDGVSCIPVWVEAMTRTITTIYEEAIPRQTAFFEPGPTVTPEERAQLVEVFREEVRYAKVVTFNGTIPDPTLNDLYYELISIAHEAGALTILDSHGKEFARGVHALPYMVKPNREEAAQWLERPCDSPTNLLRAIEFFHQRGVKLVAISLGADGLVVSRGNERFHFIPEPIEEVNPVGSGDALVAAFAIGLMLGQDLDTMATRGVAAGAANAMSWDIGHFDLDLVESLAARVRVDRL